MEPTPSKTINRAPDVTPAAAATATIGRQSHSSNHNLGPLQRAMKVSSPEDSAEKEADSTAKTIMRMAMPESSIAYVQQGNTNVFRQITKDEKEQKIQPKWQSPYILRFADSGIFSRQPLEEKEPVQRQATEPEQEEPVQRQTAKTEQEEPVQRQAAEPEQEESVQRQAAESEQEEPVQRKAEGMPNVGSNVMAEIQSSRGTGAPLPLSVRRFMEPRFQADFSNVKVHTGEKAAVLNRRLNAQAFTVRNDIFFGKGRFQPETHEGKELIAHELTHTVQQGAAIQRQTEVSISHHASPHVQRLGISDALDYFADKAHHIPGFRMFTIILGVNPINMNQMDRSAGNILRAVIEFLPGGNLITQALDNHGIIDKVANWVEQQIQSLGMTGRTIKNAVTRFLDSLGWSDIFDLGGVWNRAKRIFTDPIQRIIRFGKGLITGIINFIKEAILRPLAQLAEGTRGFDLLKAVLGENPITGDPVPRTADTLIGGFMKLIGQEEVWNNLKKANAVERAWAWFQGALAGLARLVRQIPSLFIQTFHSLKLIDIVVVPRAFAKVIQVFGSFIGQFFSWAGSTVINLLEILFSVLVPGAIPFLKKAAGAFKSILRNPIGFVGNLVRAGKLGFQRFGKNIGRHLKTSLIQWLTGTLGGAGVYIPQSFQLREILKFVLSVLGLTWQNIRKKLVRFIGERAVKAMETGFTFVVKLVKDGPAAAWELIKEQVSKLKNAVLEGIMNWVVVKVVQKAVLKLVTMLNPAGAVIQAILAIYNTITFFIQRLNQIIQVGIAFVNSIASIAQGVLGAAASRVEQTLAGVLTLAISFLARFVGLGNISQKVIEIINKVRAPIDKALDKVIGWIVKKGRAFLSRLLGGKGGPPQERLDRGLAEGQAAVNRFAGEKVGEAILRPLLAVIKARHQLQRLEPVLQGSRWAVKGEVNPTKTVPTNAQADTEGLDGTTPDKAIPIPWPKRPAANYSRIWLAPADAVSGRTPQSVLQTIPGAQQFSPTGNGAPPGGGDSIGLADAYQTRIGLVVGPKKTGRSDSEKNRFNRLLEKHGYDRSEEPTDGDHVVENQVSGPDSFANVWPLNSSENRGAGSKLNNTEVDLPDGTTKKVRNLNGRYFKIERFSA